MKINIRLFAVVKDQAGLDQVVLELAAGSTVGKAREQLLVQHPSLRVSLQRAAFAVNRRYARDYTVLNDGDELAVIPPVSGG